MLLKNIHHIHSLDITAYLKTVNEVGEIAMIFYGSC